ncbi:superoxide dismutase [Ni] [Haloferula sp. A504]|uniref:superoxide dismutase [Ni] n=1 Tax=Haloferula sp. A504 TaxID=3373601 RepID=UPI0031CAFD65|nr:superoxide dismutase, Ni [Verrucomicrobiaceae bacterium E54]
MRKALFISSALAIFAQLSPVAAHCQVPCGIYNDNNVIEAMHTDWVTIEKASKQIVELSKDPAANAHQLTRWINNKESHAQSLQETVLNYFLAQRLKSDDPSYVEKLKLCHSVIVTAMKCKQSTDPANVDKLHDLLHEFEAAFGTKEKE